METEEFKMSPRSPLAKHPREREGERKGGGFSGKGLAQKRPILLMGELFPMGLAKSFINFLSAGARARARYRTRTTSDAFLALCWRSRSLVNDLHIANPRRGWSRAHAKFDKSFSFLNTGSIYKVSKKLHDRGWRGGQVEKLQWWKFKKKCILRRL